MNFSDVINKISNLTTGEKIAFHCNNEISAIDFINSCDSSGINLDNIKIFKKDNKYDMYNDKTCYCIEKNNTNKYTITYSDIGYFLCKNYPVYEYNELCTDIQNLIKANNDFIKKVEGRLDLIEKQHDDILTRLDKLSDKLNQLDKRLDNLQIIL